MDQCVPSKKLKSALKMIHKLYEVETAELCEDDMKMLYIMVKRLNKKIKKLKEQDGKD